MTSVYESLLARAVSGGERHNAVEVVQESLGASLNLRQFVLALSKTVDRMANASFDNESIEQSDAAALVYLSVELVKRNVLACDTPLMLIERLLIHKTVEECSECLDLFEKVCTSIIQHLAENPARKSLKLRIALLKICSDLLNRVPRTLDTAFRGRVLMLLACSLSVDEKSGLNINGVFNLKNTTEYERTPPVPMPKSLDFSFYTSFWSIQSLLRAPRKLMDNVSLSSLLESVGSVLSTFETKKLTMADAQAQAQVEAVNVGAEYSAKYLTSSRLLELQLRDPKLRHQLLAQIAIVFHYMIQGSKKAPIELKSDQKAIVSECLHRIERLIVATPPNGDVFLTDLKLKLEREQNWSLWKDASCMPSIHIERQQAIVRPTDSLNLSPPPSSKRRARGMISNEYNEPKYIDAPMGKPALARLWALNIALDGADRKFEPSVQQRLKIVEQEDDPEECIEETYKKKNDTRFRWKTLRLLSRSDMMQFDCEGDLNKAVARTVTDLTLQPSTVECAEISNVRQTAE